MTALTDAASASRGTATRLTTWSLSGSALLLGLLGFAAWRFQSDLALAQASDSLMDMMGALILGLSMRIAAAPRDDQHPLGHGRAEPLGALFISVLAGILAVEVCSVAVRTLLGEADVQLSFWLLAAFFSKAAFKGVLFLIGRRHRGPAIEALTMDARNDVLVALLAIIGLTGARFGQPVLDAWFALPIGLWIGYSGIQLARENIDLLMGRAPTQQRQEELLALAATVDGVLEAHDLRAHSIGSQLSVYVHICVAAELSVAEAHDIGQAVESRLEEEEDVADCAVHVDPESVLRTKKMASEAFAASEQPVP